MNFTAHPPLPKFRIGQRVITPFDQINREIIRIHLAVSTKQQHKYRVRIFDLTNRPYSSAWIEEKELNKLNNRKSK